MTAVCSARDVVDVSDVVVTCTLSREPVMCGEWLRPELTVLTVGSYQPDRREIDVHASRRATAVYTDNVAKALANGGPIMEAVEAGALSPAKLIAIGDVLDGRAAGRASNDDLLMYHCMAWESRTRPQPGLRIPRRWHKELEPASRSEVLSIRISRSSAGHVGDSRV